MTFAYPYLLYLLLLPVLLSVAALAAKRARSRKWETLVAPTLRPELVTPPNHARRLTALIIGLMGLSLLIVALARPQWGEREVEEIHSSRNIMIALDVSRSMLTRDVQPSRLEQAKTAAFDLLDTLPEDKVGLIVFSGAAVLTVPLTHDHGAIRETLEQVNYGWVGYGGTDFNKVMELTLSTFERTDGTKALVLLTDGENTEHLKPTLASIAKEKKLIVVAAGIGTASGDSIPDPGSRDGLYRDRSGQLVISKFNPEALQLLAKDTNGEYVSLTSGENLNQMVKKVSEKLDEQQSPSSSRKIPYERYAPFLGAGLFFLVLALLLSAGWGKNRSSAAKALIFILAFGLALSPSATAEPEQEKADKQKEEENILKSAEGVIFDWDKKYLEAKGDDLIPAEVLAKHAFREGYQLYTEKQWDKARDAFSRALVTPDTHVQAEAHYNLANSIANKEIEILKKPEEAEKILADNKKLEAIKSALQESITHYDSTLKLNPSHENAEKNKKRVQEFIDKLVQQQQENQQKQDQQDQNQQQNKQDKDQKQDNKNDQQNSGNNQQKNDQKSDQGESEKKDQQDGDGNSPKDNSQDPENQKNNQGDQKQDSQGNSPENSPDNNQADQPESPKNQPGNEQEGDNQETQGNNQGQSPHDTPPKNSQGQGGTGVPEDQKDLSPEEAARILKERANMEKGTPFPYRGIGNSPPKDW